MVISNFDIISIIRQANAAKGTTNPTLGRKIWKKIQEVSKTYGVKCKKLPQVNSKSIYRNRFHVMDLPKTSTRFEIDVKILPKIQAWAKSL